MLPLSLVGSRSRQELAAALQKHENQKIMKFSLAAGARPKADAFGLKSAGLNSAAKPKKSFSFTKMIPRQAALFAKTTQNKLALRLRGAGEAERLRAVVVGARGVEA